MQQPAVPTRAAREGDEEERPQQVELLLDGERPVVQQRRRLRLGELSGEVVAEAPGEHEVDDEHSCRHGVDRQRALGQRRQRHRAGEQRDDEDETRRRQQTAGPPCPEPRQRQRARRRQLLEQQAGDEEAGQDEEHVDADEATLERTETKVEQHDGDDRHGTQALDVGAELVVGDAVQLVAHGAPPGDVWRHPVVQVDASERRVLHRRPRRPRRSQPSPRGRADLNRPPRHPPRLVVDRWVPEGPNGPLNTHRSGGPEPSRT